MLNLRFETDKTFSAVEFRLNHSETSYNWGNHESRFLRIEIYDLFVSCFAGNVHHDNLFNYFGPTKYRRNELINLRACISEIEVELKAIDSLDAFTQFFERDKFRKPTLQTLNEQFSLEIEWDSVLLKIIEVNRELIRLVSHSIREKRTMWVLGL